MRSVPSLPTPDVSAATRTSSNPSSFSLSRPTLASAPAISSEVRSSSSSSRPIRSTISSRCLSGTASPVSLFKSRSCSWASDNSERNRDVCSPKNPRAPLDRFSRTCSWRYKSIKRATTACESFGLWLS